MRACFIGFLDWDDPHPAAGGAGEPGAGIDSGASAEGAGNIRGSCRQVTLTAADTAGGEVGHDAEGVFTFPSQNPQITDSVSTAIASILRALVRTALFFAISSSSFVVSPC